MCKGGGGPKLYENSMHLYFSVPPPPTGDQVLQATPLSMHGRSALDAVEMAYAREVYVRNESTLQGLSHSLVTAFHNASTNFVDKVSIWILLTSNLSSFEPSK